MITIQNYVKVNSLEEAYELNSKKNNKIIGGMMWMRLGKSRVATAIDLSALGLDTIEETEEEFRIGCMVTLRQLETNKSFSDYCCEANKEALCHIVGVQFRNLATIGGSIYGRYGFSDVLTLFMAMDSYVELYKGGIVPLNEFSKMKYDSDILVRIIVKKEKIKLCYQSVHNAKTDIPILNCAASCDEKGNYRIAVGARPGKAVLAENVNDIINNNPDSAPEIIADTIKTESNMRGSAEYRKHVMVVFIDRAIKKLGGAFDAC